MSLRTPKRIALALLLTSVAASAPSAATDSPARSADAWLDQVEKRLSKIKTIHADLIFERIEGVDILDDKHTRHGRMAFDAGPPARFSIHFVKLIIDNRPLPQDMWYVFDGQWLVERNRTEKIFTKRQIAPADATQPHEDPLASGDGPFFLPITAKKAEILKRFDAVLIPATDSDPPQTVHVRLHPKPSRRLNVERVDVWYSKVSMLPIRAETIDDVPNQSIIQLTNPVLDQPVDPRALDVAAPTEAGWRKTIEPYRRP